MTNEEFVSAIKSSWYKELPVPDKMLVQEAMRRGVEFSMFKFLYILDDPSAIVAAGEKGSFELTFTGANGATVLNDKRDPLHDLFRSLVSD